MKSNIKYPDTPPDINKNAIGDGYRLRGGFSEELREMFCKIDAKSLTLSSGDWLDLSPLIARKSELRELSIESISVDWKSIPQFDELETLNISDKLGSQIEYGKLTFLKDLSVHGADKYIEQIYELDKLESLRIAWSKEIDLKKFSNMKSLKYLEFVDCRKLESLDGLELMKNLTGLRISCASKLKNIFALNNAKYLEYLSFYGCNKIEFENFTFEINTLKILGLCKNKNFYSLLPFKTCMNIERIHVFEMSIQDGKLSFLEQLPNLKSIRIQPKRHYDISVNDLENDLIAKYGEY
jgi:hypothetical protein